MEQERKTQIYDRLLEISLKIQIQDIPDPRYINEAICHCHLFIEEIEHFHIQISREISVMQQALNNAEAEYDYKRERLITEDEDIKKMPSIRDREAKANLQLNKELRKIKKYKNEVNDLNNLLKATNLKIKNLNRSNNDIKMQLRVLEAQLKMGSNNGSNSVYKSLIEELKKGSVNEDSFKESKTEVKREEIQDPSAPVNIDELLDSSNEKDDEIPQKLIEPEESIDINALFGDGQEENDQEENDQEENDQEEDDQEENEKDLPTDENPWPDFYEFMGEDCEEKEDEKIIDLDKEFDFNNEKGGELSQKSELVVMKDEKDSNQKENQQKQIGIDIDDLLDNLT